MRMLDMCLLAVISAVPSLAMEVCCQKQPIKVSMTLAIGADQHAEKIESHKLGYVGIAYDKAIVLEVYAGSPAAKAGIAVGDRIVDIHDRSTFGMNPIGIYKLLTGPVGSAVDVIVEHSGERRKLNLVRAEAVPEEAKRQKELKQDVAEELAEVSSAKAVP